MLMLLLSAGCTFYTGPPTVQGAPASGGQSGNGGLPSTPGGELDGGAEPAGKWRNVTSNLAGLRSGCGNLALVSAHPTLDMLIAGVANRALWASTDGAETWHALGLGALSTTVENVATSIVYDPATPEAFWESGINGRVGIVKSIDLGRHFSRRGQSGSNEVISIDFNDPDRSTQLVGGHGQKQVIFRSSDAGETWDDIGKQFPANADASTYPLVIDANTYLMGAPEQVGGKAGIYLTIDAGATWSLVSPDGGQFAPLVAEDATIYWASTKGGGLVRSSDAGDTFTQVVGAGLLQSFSPLELPDGRLVAASSNHLVASTNHGKDWRFVSAKLPYAINGFTYSIAQKAFFVWHSTCVGENPVPKDAIMRFDFDFAAKGECVGPRLSLQDAITLQGRCVPANAWGAMSKLILFSMIIAMIGIPARAAREKNPHKGFRKAIIQSLIFDAIYAFALVFLWGRWD